MRDFEWTQDLWCVVKQDGSFAGKPCVTSEEAYELSKQHKGSAIFKMNYDWAIDPFGFRFVDNISE